MKRIAHLLDDDSAGGVTRLLECMRAAPALTSAARHDVVLARKGAWRAPRVEADVIVSHLSINWCAMPMLTALRGANPSTPLIHVEHSYSEGFAALNVRRLGRFRALLRVAYALFDRVVAVSDTQAAWMERIGVVERGALTVISPVVDLAPFLSLPPSHLPARRLAAIGRLAPQKGFDLLIEAFRAADVSGATLDIYGDGPQGARLQALADRDRSVRFRGWATDPLAAFAESDAILAPSCWEPYGLVGLEARAASRPALLSDVDGFRDQIAEGGVGVAERSVEAWVDAIRAVCRQDLSARTSRGRAFAAEAETRFATRWAALLDEFGRASFAA